MFVPALPAAALSLGASIAAMQTTVSVYILGLAVGQLVYGPFSDAFGRRPLLLLGLAVYALASLVSAFAPNVHTLVVARLFQALGGCAGLALGRAMVRDTASIEDAMRDLALLNLMVAVGPGFAPMLGSALSDAFGWRSIFILLAMMGCLTLVLTWRHLQETGQPTGKINSSILLRDYRYLLSSPGFMGFSVGGGCATTAMYAFIATAPFIFMSDLHRSMHEVGLYLGLIIAGTALGAAITRQLSRTFGIDSILNTANNLVLGSTLGMLLLVQLDAMSVWSVVSLMFLYAIGAGAVSPSSLSRALGAAPQEMIGSAAGLYGFIQMAVGALCVFALGFFDNPAVACAAVLVAAGAVSQVAIRLALAWQRP
jgi:DHA1 family bicyclomycin/chloramphenicol resistance-like MFS transporter